MTLIIPLLNRSPNNYAELQYALRTMERNLPADRLILVGGLPKWCRPDLHIPHADAVSKSRKEENIRDKVLAALPHVGNFIFANDDHFLLQPFDIEQRYYALTFNGTGNYTKTVANTCSIGAFHNFDVHCPMQMNMACFDEQCGGEWPEWGYCLKSLYAAGMSGTVIQDRKVKSWPGDVPWFSTYDGTFNSMLPKLHKLFPHKSKWEK